MKKILVVDDEKSICETLYFLFKDEYKVITAQSGQQALRLLEEKPDLIILDILMPEMDGIEVLKKVKESDPQIGVIMLTAVNKVKTAVEAMKLGAIDYITKPFEVEEVRLIVQRIMDYQQLSDEVKYLQEISKDYKRVEFIGKSEAIQKVLERVKKVSDTSTTVLISGESGVGKELVAKLIHFQGPRKEKPFIAVHCAALPENLIESELFGYEKGAFTDATERKLGMFDLAKDGTLFLDEIGEMPLSTQAKLLRVIQEREYIRLGGVKVIKTEARLLAATSKDLKEEVKKGKFREDLYYRLNVFPIFIPPLRERREDIPLLVDHFLSTFQKRLHLSTKSISPESKSILQEYSWPGNVRELENIIERTLVLHREEKVILPLHLPEDLKKKEVIPPSEKGLSLRESLQRYERLLIEEALKEAGGNKSKAAKILKTTRRILNYHMKKLNLPSKGWGSVLPLSDKR